MAPAPAAWSRARLTHPEERRGHHAHQGSRRQRAGGAQVGRHRRHHEPAPAAGASVLTEYRGLTVTDLADLRAALRPASTDYKIYKNTLARRAADDAGFTEMAELRGPGGDRVRAARGRRGHRGQGAARLRQDEPEPRREGRDARAAGAERRRRRGAGRRAAPRRAARPARRRLPGAAGEGRRPVPGLHPQLRLRPQGLHRHRGPDGSDAQPEATEANPDTPAARTPRPRRQPRSKRPTPTRRSRDPRQRRQPLRTKANRPQQGEAN